MKKLYLLLLCLGLMGCSTKLGTTQISTHQISTVGATPSSMNNTPTPENYDFPAWLKNSFTPVFVTTDQNGNSTRISFINAETGEKYTIKPKFTYSGFFWLDNSNFGLLSSDKKTIFRIDILTGKISKENTGSQKIILKGNIPSALTVLGQNSKGNFILVDAKESNPKFSVEWANNQEEIKVFNRLTGDQVWDHKIEEGRYGTQFAWSPTNNSEIILVTGKADETIDYLLHNISLSIFDVTTGQLLANYFGDFGPLDWSPDGKTILFLDPASQFSTYGIPNQKGPCLLDLGSGKTRCLTEITKRIQQEGYQLISTNLYQWSHDSRSFFFTSILEKADGGLVYSGEICRYDLDTESITCLTKGMKELTTNSILSYDVSPDNQFIHLCFSSSTLLSDVVENSTEAILDLRNSQYFTWPGIPEETGPLLCAEDTLWRPLPVRK